MNSVPDGQNQEKEKTPTTELSFSFRKKFLTENNKRLLYVFGEIIVLSCYNIEDFIHGKVQLHDCFKRVIAVMQVVDWDERSTI